MVDANHAYNANTAIKLSRRMEEFDIFWFEFFKIFIGKVYYNE